MSAAYSYNVFTNEIKHPIALKYRRAERAPLYHIYNNRIYNMYCSFVFRPTHLNRYYKSVRMKALHPAQQRNE